MSELPSQKIAVPPAWVQQVLVCFQRIGPRDATDQISGLPFLPGVDSATVRRFVRAYGRESGLHGINDFVRGALLFPEPWAERVQSLGERSYPKKHRERLELAVQALGLAIVRDYRMRSYFHLLVREFFHLGESDLRAIVGLLNHVVGPDLCLRKLVRKLSTRDNELREYVLYLLAEFAGTREFGAQRPRLERLYRDEHDAYVREAFEHLLQA